MDTLDNLIEKERKIISSKEKKLGIILDTQIIKIYPISEEEIKETAKRLNSSDDKKLKELIQLRRYNSRLETETTRAKIRQKVSSEKLGDYLVNSGWGKYKDPTKIILKKRRKEYFSFYPTLTQKIMGPILLSAIALTTFTAGLLGANYISNNTPQNETKKVIESDFYNPSLASIKKGNIIIAGYPTSFVKKVISESGKKYERVPSYEQLVQLTEEIRFNSEEHKIPEKEEMSWSEFQKELGLPVGDGDRNKGVYNRLSSIVQ